MQRPSPRNTPLPALVWLQRNAIRPAIYVVGLVPAAYTLHLGLTDQLGADPVKVLERTLGLWALRFLVIGLAITPLRALGGPNWIGYRRAVGLLAFMYAAMHVTVYLWLDQALDLGAVLKDILKRPYITVGLVSFLILAPLAITSNNAMIKRIGARNWQRLHRWVYLAAAAAALHFIMLVKAWPPEPLVYAAIVATLLLFRAFNRRPTRRRPAATGATAREPARTQL